MHRPESTRSVEHHSPARRERILTELVASLLTSGLQVRLTVGGVSMWPFLCDGDRVILETVTGSALSIGDVVLFDDAERGLMLHRLVRRGHDGAGLGRFQTRSDALLRLDQPFGPDRLLARVACIEGKSRRGRDLTRRLEKMRAWATVGKGLMMSYLHYKVGWPGPHRISGHAMPGRRFPARVAARVADLSGSTE